MLKVFVFTLALLVSGCASDPKWLENRVLCTVDGEEMHVVSKWGPIEFGSQIADSDAAAVCKK
jgi:starvation-inducible outer membrane lipoprotein